MCLKRPITKRNFSSWFCLLFQFIRIIAYLSVCLSLLADEVCSKTIQVPQQQLTIQAAIDLSADGDTVLVADGIYTGLGNVNLDFKGLNPPKSPAAGRPQRSIWWGVLIHSQKFI